MTLVWFGRIFSTNKFEFVFEWYLLLFYNFLRFFIKTFDFFFWFMVGIRITLLWHLILHSFHLFFNTLIQIVAALIAFFFNFIWLLFLASRRLGNHLGFYFLWLGLSWHRPTLRSYLGLFLTRLTFFFLNLLSCNLLSFFWFLYGLLLFGFLLSSQLTFFFKLFLYSLEIDC